MIRTEFQDYINYKEVLIVCTLLLYWTYHFVDFSTLDAQRNIETVFADNVPSLINVVSQKSRTRWSAAVGHTNVINKDCNIDFIVGQCRVNSPANNTIRGQFFNDTTRVSSKIIVLVTITVLSIARITSYRVEQGCIIDVFVRRWSRRQQN